MLLKHATDDSFFHMQFFIHAIDVLSKNFGKFNNVIPVNTNLVYILALGFYLGKKIIFAWCVLFLLYMNLFKELLFCRHIFLHLINS
jgi:hypothetical protein